MEENIYIQSIAFMLGEPIGVALGKEDGECEFAAARENQQTWPQGKRGRKACATKQWLDKIKASSVKCAIY